MLWLLFADALSEKYIADLFLCQFPVVQHLHENDVSLMFGKMMIVKSGEFSIGSI